MLSSSIKDPVWPAALLGLLDVLSSRSQSEDDNALTITRRGSDTPVAYL